MEKPKLLDHVRNLIREKQYSIRTEEAYLNWIKRFILYHKKQHPMQMGETEISEFLEFLTDTMKVAPSTRNQAQNAIVFLYTQILKKDLPKLEEIKKSKKPGKLPVVFTRDEAAKVIARLEGTKWLMASLLYGSGLRLMECMRLRIGDINLKKKEITVRDAKGNEDRKTILPETLITPLKQHLVRVKEIHTSDLEHGFGNVYLPPAIEARLPKSGLKWEWQWVFPAARRSMDAQSKVMRRHHLAETVLQRAVKKAIRESGLRKAASCHTFRHSFATHLLEDGYDIETTQEIMGHKHINSTRIYTHIAESVSDEIRSPIDRKV